MRIYHYQGHKNICGKRVRKARRRNKLTQTELAARLQTENITLERDSISRIENGTRFVTDFELITLSKILNVSIEWLIGGDPSSKD